MAKYFKRTLGVDLGTVNTLIYERNRGVLLNEPSVVAVRVATGEFAGAGRNALDLLKHMPGEYVAKYPLREGVIADYYLTEFMLKNFFKRTSHPSPIKSIKVVVCVPCAITEVEKKAAVDATIAAGARDVYLIEEPVAAGIGYGIMPDTQLGCMIVDIGGGTTDIAVIAFGGIVCEKTLNVAGNAIDDEIVKVIAEKYSARVSYATAEKVKIEIGTLYPKNKVISVKGREVDSGLPVEIEVEDSVISDVICAVLDRIIVGIRELFMLTPPELSSDIAKVGIVLTGGVSQIDGCAQYISKSLGISANCTEPLTLVAKGAGEVILK